MPSSKWRARRFQRWQTTLSIRLLPITGETALRLTRAYPFFPFFATETIAAGTYPRVDEDVATVAVTALWTVGAQVPEPLVYAITAALWRDTTLRRLSGAHSAGARIALQTALVGVVIPLHPGAARYYAERGMTPAAKGP